ncbi:MAG: hypothetical protein WA055_05725 [Candidatus Moraniibacteriota bacterium]
MKITRFKFSKKIFLLLILAIFLLFIFLRFEKELIFFENSLQKNSSIKISKDQKLSGKFESTRANLTQVEILLGGGKKLTNPTAVKIKLADENCSKIIREGSVEPSYLKRKDIYEFRFSKIADSKDKKYCLILGYEPQKLDAKNLQVYTSGDQPAMRAVYVNDNTWQNINELSQRMSQYKPLFLKHYFLWAIFLSFIFFSIFLIVVLILI